MTSSIKIISEHYNMNNFYPDLKENYRNANVKMSGSFFVPSDKIVSLTAETKAQINISEDSK